MKKKYIGFIASFTTATLLCINPVFAETMPSLDFSGPHCSEEQLAILNELVNTHESVTTEDGNFTYQIVRDPFLCANIQEYHGEGGDIIIPDCIGGVRISTTSIDFSGREDIISVTHLGYPTFANLSDSFQNCSNMESFTLNAGYSDALIQCYASDDDRKGYENGAKVEQRYTLSANKFDGCTNLKTVSLPYTYGNSSRPEYSCSYIATECFKDCTALQEIELGGYVKIAEDAFVNCTALEKVVFDENVYQIGDHALGYIKDEDGNYERYDGLTIYGVAGTVAETYAKDNDIPFITSSSAIYTIGDANNDGKVSIADAVLVSRYVGEDRSVTITDIGLANADINEDGTLSMDDVTAIIGLSNVM